MSEFRLRTIAKDLGWNDISKGEWASEPFKSATAAAEERMLRSSPFSMRVVKVVDGKPADLTHQEAHEVTGVTYRFQREEWEAEQRRKGRAA